MSPCRRQAEDGMADNRYPVTSHREPGEDRCKPVEVHEKLEGVESVEASLQKASAEIRLTPDNKITLPQIRRIISSNGYPTKDAEITARGRIVGVSRPGDGKDEERLTIKSIK